MAFTTAAICAFAAIGGTGGDSTQARAAQIQISRDTALRVAVAEMQLDVAGAPVYVPGRDVVELRFSIQSQQGELIRALAGDAASIWVDGEPLSGASLEKTSQEHARVVVALDLSGSMEMQAERWGASKLLAAKEALQQFITSLRPGDEVELIVFDNDVRSVARTAFNGGGTAVESRAKVPIVVGDLSELSSAVSKIAISRSGSQNFTNLYGALEVALLAARQKDAQNVLVITDGMHDTEQEPAPTAASECRSGPHAERISGQEQRLAQMARNIRIFTIGVGDDKVSRCSLGWADFDTLDNISRITGGGAVNRITPQDVAAKSGGIDPTALQKMMAVTLDRIRDSLKHEYQLVVPFKIDRFVPNVSREFRVEIRVETSSNSGASLPVLFSLVRNTGGRVNLIGEASLLPMIPIVKSGAAGDPLRYGAHYSLVVLALAMLALLPKGRDAIARMRARKIADTSVLRLGAKSGYVGRTCPNEARVGGAPFSPGDYAVICPACQTPHHIACWIMGNKHQCWKCRRQVRLTKQAEQLKDE